MGKPIVFHTDSLAQVLNSLDRVQDGAMERSHYRRQAYRLRGLVAVPSHVEANPLQTEYPLQLSACGKPPANTPRIHRLPGHLLHAL